MMALWGDGATLESVKAIVDNPEDAVVTEIEGTLSSVIELKGAKEDIGKIIGKQVRMVVTI